jgi:hypothetical protein
MTTETLLASGQPDNATASSQTAADAPTNQGANADNQQQAAAPGTDTQGQPAAGAADQGATGDKPAGDDTKPDEDKKPAGAPEQYEDFTAPDGVTLDAEVTGEFKGLAKELGLTQEQAQKVADFGPKMLQRWQAKQAEALAETSAKWATETRADKDIGGDKLNENLATAKKALDAFGSPAIKTLLHESGLGNHPEVIRLLVNAGKAISEDRMVPGAKAAAEVSIEQRLYPNDIKK